MNSYPYQLSCETDDNYLIATERSKQQTVEKEYFKLAITSNLLNFQKITNKNNGKEKSWRASQSYN